MCLPLPKTPHHFHFTLLKTNAEFKTLSKEHLLCFTFPNSHYYKTFFFLWALQISYKLLLSLSEKWYDFPFLAFSQIFFSTPFPVPPPAPFLLLCFVLYSGPPVIISYSHDSKPIISFQLNILHLLIPRLKMFPSSLTPPPRLCCKAVVQPFRALWHATLHSVFIVPPTVVFSLISIPPHF